MECKGKNVKIIINPRFYFTDKRKQLWNCCYQSAEDNYWSSERNKNGLTEPKKVPSQIFFLLVPLGTIAQLFTKKNVPLHNPFK